MSNEVRYSIELRGVSPLIMHRDNIEFSSAVSGWQKDPQNKKTSVAGDDRSPAWTWIGYIYSNGKKGADGKVVLDSDNIMTMLREAGAKMSTGKGKATFKAVTQYGLYINEMSFSFYNNGVEIATDWMNSLIGENDFDKHLEAANEHGIELFMKRARIGMGARASKHVRIRPKFNDWMAKGTITVIDPSESGLKKDVLQRILDIAGCQVGLCDWRPSCPSAGPFGKFVASVTTV